MSIREDIRLRDLMKTEIKAAQRAQKRIQTAQQKQTQSKPERGRK